MQHRSGRRRTTSAILCAALLSTGLHAIATAPPAAAATTIHVPADQPTIAAALAAAADGDTIEVAPGTYAENLSFEGKDVHLVSTGGPETTTIDGVAGTVVRIGPNGTIEGFTITGGTADSAAAVVVAGNGPVIRGNRIVSNASSQSTISLFLSAATIDRNLFSGNSCPGAPAETSAVIPFLSSTISNNLFVDNTCTRALKVVMEGWASTVVNNTIVGSPIGFEPSQSAAVFRNNLVAGNGIGIRLANDDDSLPASFDHNLVGANDRNYFGVADPPNDPKQNITADPQVVDLQGRDLRLTPSSPAVDAGSDAAAPLDDFDGSVRPLDGPDVDGDAEFDIGAFEWDGSEPPPVRQTGSLDTAWSSDGSIDVQTPYYVSMAHAGSDGLFTASFRESLSPTQMRVAKYEASGALSTGFGTNGSILRNFGVGGLSFPTLIEPSGTGLIVVGEHYTSTRSRLGLTRLRADGTYDPTFSGDGRATYKVFSAEHDILTAFRARVLTGGKIALAVAALDYDGNGVLQLTGQAILRLNANGSADTSYSGDARLPLTKDYSDIAFFSNGAAYAGRQVGTVHEIRKLTAGGNADKTFSGDGIVPVNCGTHRGANLALDSAGRPVLMCVRTSPAPLNLGMFRFTTTGAPDTTYSGDGKTALVLTGGASDTWTLHFDTNALPWAAIRSASDPKSFLVFTLDANGAPNAAFSGDGKATITLPTDVDLGSLEKGATRLYVEDFRTATTVRISAVAT
jgi:uncharacterized delta-60 repeat protein